MWQEGKDVAGRKRCGRKKCTTKRDDRSLEKIVTHGRFRNLGELHKEWTQAGVKASRATTHRRLQEKGYKCRIPSVKPLLNSRQRKMRLAWAKEKKTWTIAHWSKVLFSDESKFCISFGNQGPRVWRKSGETHNAKSTTSWFARNSIPVLDWPANLPDLNPIENLWGIVKRKMRNTRPHNTDELKSAIKSTWASITPQECHRLIMSMPRRIDAVIRARGGPTKY